MLIKIPVVFFIEIGKLNVKFMKQHKGLTVAKIILNEVGRLTPHNINTYYKVTVIKLSDIGIRIDI